MKTPTYDKVHAKFKLNGNHYDHTELKEVAYSLVKEGVSHEKTTGTFLLDWLDGEDHIKVQTSGTTGTPKMIPLSKQAMVNSSILTGNFLKLKPGNTAMHCLPTNYIAGKMMLVRALVLGLEMDVVEPTSQPIFDYDKIYHFSAMLPMQLESTLGYLHHVKTIIVGGSSMSNHLIAMAQTVKPKIYATYGMTETATHIALRRINGPLGHPYFKVLPTVKIWQDERDCLVIEAPKVAQGTVVTNDLVKLHSDSEFEWLGRIDNVINSGGVKLFPEKIEEKLKGKISNRFIIASLPDALLGEKLILIIEGDVVPFDKKNLEGLDKFEIPKAIHFVPKFAMTATGKIMRSDTVDLINR